MGTRHLILVYYKGQYHIAQYGQWDGYPDVQGITVLEFVSDPANLSKLTAVLDAGDMLYEPTQEQLNAWDGEQRRAEIEHDERRRKITDPAEARLVGSAPTLRPSLSRDTGAEILELVANTTEPVPIVKALDFITECMMCEWAYVVDLDEGAMEVYSGWSDEGESRFRKVEALKDAEYLPSLVGRWKFTDLPTETEFLDWFSDEEE